MRELHERLTDHVIICGYGVKGRAIVDELLAHGIQPENIVAIDPNEESTADAAKKGVSVALRGDASSELLLGPPRSRRRPTCWRHQTGTMPAC